jgi:hypothetical protein
VRPMGAVLCPKRNLDYTCAAQPARRARHKETILAA